MAVLRVDVLMAKAAVVDGRVHVVVAVLVAVAVAVRVAVAVAERVAMSGAVAVRVRTRLRLVLCGGRGRSGRAIRGGEHCHEQRRRPHCTAHLRVVRCIQNRTAPQRSDL